MKANFKIAISMLLAVVAAATVADMTGVFESLPVLATLCGFLSFGKAGLAVAAVAVTETAPQEPDGTTVVTAKADGDDVEEQSYLDEDLNKKLVLIRPQDTPIDTITREIGNTEACKSWEAGGWELGVRDIVDTLAAQVTGGATEMTVTNPDMWVKGDTFTVVDAAGLVLDGGKPISCIVNGVSGNKLTVKRIGDVLTASVPAIANGKQLLRQTRAVSELEASVEGINPAPSNRKYFNQTHMTQVEESVIHALHAKKVAMDFSVYKEQTLWDFKRGMELANLFQVGGITKNDKGELVHLSTGLWHQMDRQSTVNFATGMTDQVWNNLGKEIYEGNNGSERRLLLAGPDLLCQFANVAAYAKQLEAKNTELVMGVKVFRVETPYGELLIKPLGSLMQGYFSKCGMVVDVNFLKKFVMEPLTTTALDLNKTGQRRVDNAIRIHETYSLYLENLPAHRRIIPA